MKTDPGAAFAGAKAILVCDTRLVVLRRDDIPTISYPNRIDLPGGGREGAETPAETAARETREEVGLRIDPARLTWAHEMRSRRGNLIWMLGATITAAEAAALVLGDEGQACWMMEIEDYLAAEDAIAHMQDATRRFLAARPGLSA